MSRRRSPIQMWGAPVILGSLSMVGLLAALLADGLGDVVSWLTLMAPVTVVAWYSLKRV